MGFKYRVGDYILYEYDSDIKGSGVIEAINRNGWDYAVRLDNGKHDNGIPGHACNGLFSQREGFYMDEHHVICLLDRPSNAEISEAALEAVLG